jgi:hypothetical protein
MTNTLVIISDDMGMRVPSVPEVAASQGAGVTFKAANGVDSLLYFSPAAEAILVPAPASPVTLNAGTEVSYTFEHVHPGSYGVYAQSPDDPAPENYDFGPARVPPMLAIMPGAGTDFPTPVNTPDT